MKGTDVPAHPAATVILLRDAEEGLETLLLRRNSKLAFHGGAWVFPGGRIDPQDYPTHDAQDDMAAARHAAVREAHEEAGLVIAPERLVFFSHWTTPEERPQRFSTWFFATIATADAVQIDGGEIHAHQWMQPSHALEAQRAREIELPPPTFVTLLKLTPYDSAEAALSTLATQSPETYFPRTLPITGGACSLYTEDAGYETRDVDSNGARHRLWMLDSGWRYERSA